MLTQEEVKRYAHMRRLKLIDHIWKDYLQDILLHILYRKTPKMVFSGGTCLWKVFKGDRFSEDIDAYVFPMPKGIADYLKNELNLLGINCNVLKERQTANMLFLKLALSFPAHSREIIVSVEILSAKPKETITHHAQVFDLVGEKELFNKILNSNIKNVSASDPHWTIDNKCLVLLTWSTALNWKDPRINAT